MEFRAYIVLGLVILGFSATSFAYYDDAFATEGGAQKHQGEWMIFLPDKTKWMEITFPATHDSAALRGGPWAETQSMSIAQQLKAGIRWFDIRAKWERDSFPIYHGLIYQGQDLRDVLNVMQDYLAEHPSESITMRLSQEGESGRHSYRSFGETFEKRYRRTKPGLFWMRHWQGNRDVSLDVIRGSIYLLHDFEPFPDPSGAYVPGSYYRDCNIQDEYKQTSAAQMHNKWEAVKEQILRANGRWGGYNCYINYLSSSGVAPPYFWAGGRTYKSTDAPRTWTGQISQGENSGFWPDFPRDCSGGVCTIFYPGINTLTKHYLKKNPWITYAGAMPADFPGPGLIQAIINVNFR